MRLHTKALYNLLKYNHLEDPSLYCEKWQIEDLRDCDLDELFKKLEKNGMFLDKSHFILYGQDCDSPEELSDCLLVDNQSTMVRDKIYLVLFELWRRLLPEKPSLSVFCDELDYRIHLYDKGELETDELIQDCVANLLDILDENIDEGSDPKEVFLSISKYSAHDLESFLYDYIADQIDADNDTYASDLIESFYQFLTNWKWFDFLNARIVAKTDIIIANDILKKIIDSESLSCEVGLSLEILKFMVQVGDIELFLRLAKITLKSIKNQTDFSELLETVSEFFRRLDKEEKALFLEKIIKKRKSLSSHQVLNQKEADILAVQELLNISL